MPTPTPHDDFALKISPFEDGWRFDHRLCLRCFADSGLTLSNFITICDRALQRDRQGLILEVASYRNQINPGTITITRRKT